MIKKNDFMEFVGQTIDIFEDFLEEKGIDIPNGEKTESECPAIIYGTDYGELQSELESLLHNWKLVEGDIPDHRMIYELAEQIVGDAPGENECTDEENEFYAECANIVNCYHDFACAHRMRRAVRCLEDNGAGPEQAGEAAVSVLSACFKIPRDTGTALKAIVESGVDADEAETVLQALGYILFDKELCP